MASKSQDGVGEITKGLGGLGIGGEKKKGFVYVIKEIRPPGNIDIGPQLYKFGQSENPDTRRNNLQTGNARRLEIIATKQVSDMTAAEGTLRTDFEPHMCRWGGGTEWFMNRRDMENFEDWVIGRVNRVN